MDVLRNLFGNLSAGIIRLLVTVGILAAVYFFLVRPVLDKTGEISREVNGNIEKSFKQVDVSGINHQVQREIKRSLRQSQRQGQAEQLINCIQRANQNVIKIQHCSERFR